MLSKGFGVNGGDVDSSLVLLGDWLEFFGKLLAFLSSLGKYVAERDTGLELERLVSHIMLPYRIARLQVHEPSCNPRRFPVLVHPPTAPWPYL